MVQIRIKNRETINEAAKEFVRGMGDNTVFAFNGGMGVGKTTFIKAVCEELGVKEVINSPTFAILNEYYSEAVAGVVYQFDFYRIHSVREAYDIGAADYFDSGALCFIEWPDKVESLLPDTTVFVDMVEQEDGLRILTIH
jgi:tRNA threonylcarbamoyladenosine biosynthesis protein TsaE